MESEIKQAWKQGFVTALHFYTLLTERGEESLWQLAEDAWMESHDNPLLPSKL
jgi:hypothetical protein